MRSKSRTGSIGAGVDVLSATIQSHGNQLSNLLLELSEGTNMLNEAIENLHISQKELFSHQFQQVNDHLQGHDENLQRMLGEVSKLGVTAREEVGLHGVQLSKFVEDMMDSHLSLRSDIRNGSKSAQDGFNALSSRSNELREAIIESHLKLLDSIEGLRRQSQANSEKFPMQGASVRKAPAAEAGVRTSNHNLTSQHSEPRSNSQNEDNIANLLLRL